MEDSGRLSAGVTRWEGSTVTVSKRVLKTVRDLTVGDSTAVLNAVQRHVLQHANDPDPERDMSYLHPSDMAKSDWCWRHDYYRLRRTPIGPRSQNPSFTMENVFEEGHEIHRKWQRWLWEMGVLYGVWHCRACDARWWDRSPKECLYCGHVGLLKYKELPLTASHLHLGGMSDGGIMMDDEPFKLLEIKSVSLGTLRFEAPHLYDQYLANESLDKIWMQVQRPFPSHLRQGALYLYMATRGVEHVPIPSEMVFIYEWKPRQQVKEFRVKYSARHVEHALYGAELVTQALETTRPPIRPPWARDEDSKICSSCVYRSVCWKLDDAPSQEVPAKTPVKRASADVRRRLFAGAPKPRVARATARPG